MLHSDREHAARLLREAAEWLRQGFPASFDTDATAQRASEFLKYSDILIAEPDSNSASAEVSKVAASPEPDQTETEAKESVRSTEKSSRVQGCWIRRPSWFKRSDRPNEISGLVKTEWKPLSDSNECDNWFQQICTLASQGGSNLTPELSRLHFIRPRYLRDEVVLVHADHSSKWDAMFSLAKDPTDSKRNWTARSFDFASPELHRLNLTHGLNTVGSELAYLRYFMHIVRGEEGAFRLLEGDVLEDALEWLKNVKTTNNKDLDQVVRNGGLRFKHVTLNGALAYDATILYGGVVFIATLALYPNGMVEMLDDTPQVSAPIQSLRE